MYHIQPRLNVFLACLKQHMQLLPEQLLVRQLGSVLGHQSRGQVPAQGILDHLCVPVLAEQDADAVVLVWLLHVPVQGLQVEAELPQVLRLELVRLQLKGNQALQPPVVEKQVHVEIAVSDLKPVLLPHKQEVPAQLQNKAPHLGCQSLLKRALAVRLWQVQELEHIAVLEDIDRILVQSFDRRRLATVPQHHPLEHAAVDLPFQLPDTVLLPDAEAQIELALLLRSCP